MAVDAKLIKELRDKTGMGITDCKNALVDANADLEQAELLLRKRQKEKAIKKADRPTGEGVIAVKVEGDTAVIVEVACEQEPTTGNELFSAFVQLVLDKAMMTGAASAQELLAVSTDSGTLADDLTGLAGTVGENVQLKRVGVIKAPAGGIIGKYVHFNNKAGAVCALKLEGVDPANIAVQTAASDICMHAVAVRPVAVDRDGIDAAVVEKEKEVYRDEIKNKPENIQEKILEGKLRKFYSEKVLLEQAFVKDPSGKQSVAEMLAAVAKAAGGTAEIVGFARFELGL